jgi:serine protease inhibitor
MRDSIKKYWITAFSLLLGAVGPLLAGETIPGPSPEGLAQAQTGFGLRFFQEILEENPGKNTLVSPYSAFAALGMLYNGAAGTTKEGMEKTLSLGAMETSQVNQDNLALLTDLQNGDPKTELDIANSLWGNQAYPIKPAFIQVDQDFYHAEVNQLDFSKPGASDKVNQWVSDKTKGKIPTIIGPLGKADVLVLVNAVYFKGTWVSQFKKEKTGPDAFHLTDGTAQDKPFMHQTLETLYLATEDFQAVRLPYGNGRLGLWVFLPSEKSSLSDFCSTLTPENWDDWMKSSAPARVALSLPKFKIEFQTSMIPSLAGMGMSLAFDKHQADFSGIGNNLHVSEAIQKTYMLVDEEGTEAAAATAIRLRANVVHHEPPAVVMTVDRPFFIALVDSRTKVLLFAGAVTDPKQE